MGVSVLGHDLVALGALAGSGAAQDPDHGQLGVPQRGLVDVLPLQGLRKKLESRLVTFEFSRA